MERGDSAPKLEELGQLLTPGRPEVAGRRRLLGLLGIGVRRSQVVLAGAGNALMKRESLAGLFTR
ncbi:hypothetical protein [Streptomyces sp. NPDC046727]|uniref:hypothetical protein n=1 Tax=Streptomyces sp. NPDC046727 TaxID=3155373 RepID=UPI0033E18FF8